MLALSEKDIFEAITMKDAMDAIEQAFLVYDSGAFKMPTRMHTKQNDSNTLLLMPCFFDKGFGTKLVTVFPGNSLKSVSATQGVMVMNDPETGAPLSLLNGTTLTALKTGAVGGVSIRFLAGPNANSVGLVGTGLQGMYQILAACEARNITNVYLYNKTPDKIPLFTEQLNKKMNKVTSIHAVKSVHELVEASDIVISATTSEDPVLPDDPGLFLDKHVIGIGSYQPTMREFSKSLFEVIEELYIDTLDAKHESGDVMIPLAEGWLREDQVVSFAEVVSGKRNIRHEKGKTTAFKSVGMALFDVMVAHTIYEKAKELGIGKIIEL